MNGWVGDFLIFCEANRGPAGAPAKATIQRIDQDRANAKRRWLDMGALEPSYAADLARPSDASRLRCAQQAFPFRAGMIEREVAPPPLSLAAGTLQNSPRDDA